MSVIAGREQVILILHSPGSGMNFCLRYLPSHMQINQAVS